MSKKGNVTRYGIYERVLTGTQQLTSYFHGCRLRASIAGDRNSAAFSGREEAARASSMWNRQRSSPNKSIGKALSQLPSTRPRCEQTDFQSPPFLPWTQKHRGCTSSLARPKSGHLRSTLQNSKVPHVSSIWSIVCRSKRKHYTRLASANPQSSEHQCKLNPERLLIVVLPDGITTMLKQKKLQLRLFETRKKC